MIRCRCAPLVLWLALAVAPPRATAAPATAAPATSAPSSRPAAEKKAQRGSRWYALPIMAFSSDDGLAFGAHGELAFHAPGYAPYRTAYVLHTIFSLRGFQLHRFRFDRVGLGPGRRLRLTVHATYRQWLNDGYWGIGNDTARERAFAESFDADDPRRKRYRYTLRQPFAHATLRAALDERWALVGALTTKWSAVESYAGSLLAEQRPFGSDGGLGVLLTAGLVYDTRDPEPDPRRGIFAEASARVALPMPKGAGSFGGPFLSVRGYGSPLRWLTLAGRLMGEWLFGNVPFYELVHWGGSVPIIGFGGFETLRGVAFGRWRAPGKAVLNAEARVRVLRHTVFRRSLAWQVVLFGDAGVVWGETDSDPSQVRVSLFPIHWGAGLGLRAVFQELFVVRIDGGLSIDPIAEPDGRVTDAVAAGLYVVFNHAF